MSNPFAPEETANTADPNPFFETAQTGDFKPEEVFGAGFEGDKPAATQSTPPPPSLEFQPAPSATVTTTSAASPKPQQPTKAKTPKAPTPAPAPISEVVNFEQPSSNNSAILSGTSTTDSVSFEVPAPQQPTAPVDRKWYHLFYKLSWYQPYFNVDTKDVLARMLSSVALFLPYIKRSNDQKPKGFLELVRPHADLYGPFWITTTLLFVVAATSNFGNYLRYWKADRAEDWEYSFNDISIAAGVFYVYTIAVPLALWLQEVFWMRLKIGTPVDFWCVYGYAWTPILFLTPICVLAYEWVRWPVLILAFAFSTAMIVLSLVSEFKDAKKQAVIVIPIAAVLHVGLFLVYKLVFFTNWSSVTPASQATD